MKVTRFLMIIIFAFTVIGTAKADNDRPIRFEQLPEKSKEFIRKFFSEKDISYIKMESEFLFKSYEVYFVDGSKVEFDKRGEWDNVECKKRKIPDGIAPDKIARYVEKNHSNSKIIKIDRDSRSYEIELDNNVEIKFDMRFNVIEYDD
ncbi:MAG TPA: hypothetical protein DEQ30_06485 [Porphyromonadaceae bacterium]|nr:hypothetical protein [Porphyromonadaceae bacterium]